MNSHLEQAATHGTIVPAERRTGEIEAAQSRRGLEERFHHAKETLRHAQQQKCEAMYAFLAVRAELNTLLETILPGAAAG